MHPLVAVFFGKIAFMQQKMGLALDCGWGL
jgi:hypothetical protein